MHARDVEHRPRRHTGALEALEPLVDASLPEDIGEDRHQWLEVGHARRIVGEARVLLQIGPFQGFEQAQPVGLIGGADGDPAVCRLERLIGRAQGMRRAERTGRPAGGEGHRRLPVGMGDGRLEQRGVHSLSRAGPLSVIERAQHAHGRQDAGGDVRERCTAFDGRAAAGFAGDAHDARHALGNQIEAGAIGVRAGAPEARQAPRR